MKRIAITSLLASLLSFTGVAGAVDLSGAGFTAEQLRGGAKVYDATVEQMLSATADKSKPGIGAGVGAAVGGIAAGSSGGSESAKLVKGLLGAVIGGVVGNTVENYGKSDTCSITFILKVDGVTEKHSVTQECTPKYQYAVGQRVYLLVAKLDGVERVVPAQ